MTFNRLLVPLDGSDAARAALIYAAAIPSERVRLLTVLTDEDAGSGFAPAELRDSWRDQWRVSVDQYLENAASDLRAQGRVVEQEVVFGDPAEWIDEYARDADMIIMTTHGRGAGRRVVYGSVADRVSRTATIPVMLIRGGEQPIAAQPIVRLVTPLDGSEVAEQSLPFVSALALRLGTPVLMARAIDSERFAAAASIGASPVSKYAESPDVVRASASGYLEERAEILREHDIEVETEVVEGEAAPAISGLTLPGDVLVLTSHGRSGIGRWMLGSVAEKLIRHAETPVIVIRAKERQES